MSDKISVIAFTCNREDDFKRCLASIARQSEMDYELLIINNGEDRAVFEIAKAYAHRMINDKTKKLSYLFNLAWRNAERDWIVYLADDVELGGGWLCEAMRCLKQNPGVAVVTGPLISPYKYSGQMHALYEEAGKSYLLRLISKFYGNFVLEGKTFEPCILCESGGYTLGQAFVPDFIEQREVDLATTSCMLIKRSAIESVGGFDENFFFNHADGDLFVRLKKAGYKIIYDPLLRAVHHNRIGPSRLPFFIGRDTAYFYLKDIRPKSVRGFIAAFTNIFILNTYWVFKALSLRDFKQLRGLSGFIKGVLDYILR